ncbi:hypothetical protein B0H11DRAFT_17236 [Mycena galericulata]|nr:hypothetical protein B0H11DRAFT_17236 [Mycena galericulata]
MTPTMTFNSCPKCGFDFVQGNPRTPEDARLQLRGRLSELDSLIAALTAERDILRAKSDSIIYPVLTLPPEITTGIFMHCLPTATLPSPSPSTAPLLLAQVCQQWRQLALDTPWLWRSLAFKDSSSVEILKIWLSRAGSLPLHYSLHCSDPSRADAILDTSILYAHQWQDVSLAIPLMSFPKLDLGDRSLHCLRKISLAISHPTRDQSFSHLIQIHNAPLLREAHISTLPKIKFDLTRSQLTSVTLQRSMELMECISLIQGCPGLLYLAVSTTGSIVTPTIPYLTLEYLESFTSNLGDVAILRYLTLPRLHHLTVVGAPTPQHATVFAAFIRRSACPIRSLSLWVSEMLMPCLRCVPDTVSALTLTWQHHETVGELFPALQAKVILPRLQSLSLRGTQLSAVQYPALVDALRARRVASPGTVSLDYLMLTIDLRGGLPMPGAAVVAQLRALASGGMKIKFAVSEIQYTTNVILKSSDFDGEAVSPA